MFRIPAVSLVGLLCGVLLVTPAGAGLRVPVLNYAPDSSVVRVEKGIESLRSTETLGLGYKLPQQFFLQLYGRWKTDWQQMEGETERVRQDGRWYAGARGAIFKPLDVWIAGEGEHFDDRPRNADSFHRTIFSYIPVQPDYSAASDVSTAQGVNAIRILRSGGGFAFRPASPVSLVAGMGVVDDRRLGRQETGMGLWLSASVDTWKLGGYEQTASLEFNQETPKNHKNRDFRGKYEVYREFSEGNTNRTEAFGSQIERDVYLDASGRLSHRKEKNYGIRDKLIYSISRAFQTEVSGDLVHQSTDLGDASSASSSLIENQAGFETALTMQAGKSSGQVVIGARTITQTIRGDILQGRKTDLALIGETGLLRDAKLKVRIGVSKYSLDTRSESNYDDRDELRYTIESAWWKPLFHTVAFELHTQVRLDHLVYIYSQRSSNNRWTRFFLLGTRINHSPTDWFYQSPRFDVSANYQDYDYEVNPRTTRSTVFRKFVTGDSLALNVSSSVLFSANAGYTIEEFGRLFWSDFEEELSDETRSQAYSVECLYSFYRNYRAGGGGLWEKKRGKRFPDSSRNDYQIFQNIETYGPIFRLERIATKGILIRCNGRILRQSQLNNPTRWISSGELTVSMQW